ncbi:MAG: GNAT family N-acetyltransferase [Roseovarius sp.]
MLTLYTDRLILRPVTPDDAADVHDALACVYDIVRHTGSWIWPADRTFTAEKCTAGFGPEGGWLVARMDGALAGMVGVKHDGDFGYMLPQKYWGQGLATEMGHAVIGHVQNAPYWPMLKACVFEDNPGSARVLEKLGFTEGPACRGHCAARGGEFPTRTFTKDLPQG